MDFPKLVALDTELVMMQSTYVIHSSEGLVSGIIWEGRLDEESWGKGLGAADSIEDNIERVDCSLLRDKRSVPPHR